MTKRLLTLTFISLLSLSSYGQKSNSLFIGLNTFAQIQDGTKETTNQSSGNSFKTHSKYYSINFLPQIGFKFQNNIRIGLGLGYQRSQTKSISGVDSPDPYHIYNRTNLYTGRLYASKDLRISKWLNFFVQANLDFLKEREIKEDYNSTSSGLYSHRAYYFNPNLMTGLRAALNNKLDVEITYGRIGYINGKLITDAGGVDSDYTLKSFDLNFTSDTITIGLKYSLGKSEK